MRFVCALIVSTLLGLNLALGSEISFTMDDPEVTESPLYTSRNRNHMILAAFKKHQIKGALFVCGMRIDNPEGKQLLKDWDHDDHILANHSYSHLYYHGKNVSFPVFSADFEKVEPLLAPYRNFEKLFRFPFLKEGDTLEKRDQMRTLLKQKGYAQGYVTIDASDWYIDERMRQKLAINPNLDLRPYRQFYFEHMLNRAKYYDNLARKVFGHRIKHTILIHHSLLNALFLDDLMTEFTKSGWKLISAQDAFKDQVFKLQPNIVPAGESLVWAAAKETGKFENELRYPGEDGAYEKAEMDKRGL